MQLYNAVVKTLMQAISLMVWCYCKGEPGSLIVLYYAVINWTTPKLHVPTEIKVYL